MPRPAPGGRPTSDTTVAPYGHPYWLDVDRPAYAPLDRDIKVDAAVIGAGISGLKVARLLSRHGVKTAILEGGRVGDGASARNQGSVNHSTPIGYSDCIRRHSRAVAKQLWQLGLDNHKLLRVQLEEYRIACDYQRDGMVTLARRDMEGWEEGLRGYWENYELLREDGFEVEWLDESDAQRRGGNPVFAAGFNYLADAQFHSGKYLVGLAAGVARLKHVTLYEHTRLLRHDRDGTATRLTTTGGTVTAAHVFLTTNALVPQFVPALERSLRAERGQAFVTEPLGERPCTGSFGTPMAWWREIIEPGSGGGRYRLLFGGGRKRDEPDSLFPQFTPDSKPHPKLEPEGFNASAAHQARLDAQFTILFPHLSNAKITHRWGGLQCFTADDMPIIGTFDAQRNIHGVAGYCGRGNCYADIAAEYLVGRAVGAGSDIERRYGPLIESLMRPGRESARWGEWKTIHNNPA